jgi:ficolin
MMSVSSFAVWVLLLGGLGTGSQASTPEGWELGNSQFGNPQLSLSIKCPDPPVRTCKDVMDVENRTVVTLSDGLEVLCDTKTDRGGWIVFQRRLSSEVDFYRNWTDYKYGFGDIRGNFWLGNEKIHRLTSLRRYQLRVDFTFNSTSYFAEYSKFRIFGEAEKYQLEVEGYSGNAGDSLGRHNGMAFSTKDRDNDIYTSSCATGFHGAWWYEKCHYSNLNGLWGSKNYAEGLTWFATTGYYDTATSTEIKIRPLD